MYQPKPERIYSEFSKKIQPIGRILQNDEYVVWGCAPMYDEEGKVHVFFSKWLPKYREFGWRGACEIGHAVADKPEGPYTVLETVLTGRGGDNWDSWTIHNPSVYKIDGKYVLLFIGTNGSVLGKTMDELMDMTYDEAYPYQRQLMATKRVGMAVADSLYGPWTRVSVDEPIIDAGKNDDDWDNFVTSNPAFVRTPEGKYRIYYKGWNLQDDRDKCANRMYGFAEADKLEGPYVKCPQNPVVSYKKYGPVVQNEDGYVWYADGKYKMVLRDMGVFSQQDGLYIESDDGIEWTEPQIAYEGAWKYFDAKEFQGEQSSNRFERPQILFKDGKPDYLFMAYHGYEGKLSSGVVFKINE